MLWLFCATGVVGAYTTVSSFALMTLRLWQDGARRQAVANVVISTGLVVGGGGAWPVGGRGMSVWVAFGAALGAGARAGLWWLVPLYGTLGGEFRGLRADRLLAAPLSRACRPSP